MFLSALASLSFRSPLSALAPLLALAPLGSHASLLLCLSPHPPFPLHLALALVSLLFLTALCSSLSVLTLAPFSLPPLLALTPLALLSLPPLWSSLFSFPSQTPFFTPLALFFLSPLTACSSLSYPLSPYSLRTPLGSRPSSPPLSLSSWSSCSPCCHFFSTVLLSHFPLSWPVVPSRAPLVPFSLSPRSSRFFLPQLLLPFLLALTPLILPLSWLSCPSPLTPVCLNPRSSLSWPSHVVLPSCSPLLGPHPSCSSLS